jgi:hypothetical protein
MLMKATIDKYLMTELLEDFADATVTPKSKFFNQRVPYNTWKLLKSVCKWDKQISVEFDLDRLIFKDEAGKYVCILDETFIHFFNSCIEWDSTELNELELGFDEMQYGYRMELPKTANYEIYKDLTEGYEFDLKTNTIQEKLNSNEINYNIEEERKESKTMNMFSKLNLEFGPVASTVIRLSPFGLAIKTANREWHTYDAVNQKIVDVSDFSFNLGDTPILYKMPVAPDAVAVGDLILHNGVPVYVLDFADASNKSAGFIVIDTDANERKTILPVCNVFNFNFITKVVSLFNFGNGANIFGTPTADQPFGNIFPLMMMSEMFKDNGKSNDNDFFKMMMMSQMFSGGVNPFAQMFGGLNATPAKNPGGPMDA